MIRGQDQAHIVYLNTANKKNSAGKSREELALEKQMELERRLIDVSGQLNSGKKPVKTKREFITADPLHVDTGQVVNAGACLCSGEAGSRGSHPAVASQRQQLLLGFVLVLLFLLVVGHQRLGLRLSVGLLWPRRATDDGAAGWVGLRRDTWSFPCAQENEPGSCLWRTERGREGGTEHEGGMRRRDQGARARTARFWRQRPFSCHASLS